MWRRYECRVTCLRDFSDRGGRRGGDTALHEGDFETGADTQKHGDAVKTAPPWA